MAGLLAADEESRGHHNGNGFSMNSMVAGVRQLADEHQEWAGIPVPLQGERLTIDKSYPFASVVEQLNEKTSPSPTENSAKKEEGSLEYRNSFFSSRLCADIHIIKLDGKFTWFRDPGIHNFRQVLTTLGCSDAWSLETELTAMQTLRSLVDHRKFRQYLMTGMFIESSKKSGVFYIFRRLRPTVAMSGSTGDMKILCTLCLHPIAYYQNSYAGAMCPTDDVIAHVALMRGDEKMFWRRANQHHPANPISGI